MVPASWQSPVVTRGLVSWSGGLDKSVWKPGYQQVTHTRSYYTVLSIYCQAVMKWQVASIVLICWNKIRNHVFRIKRDFSMDQYKTKQVQILTVILIQNLLLWRVDNIPVTSYYILVTTYLSSVVSSLLVYEWLTILLDYSWSHSGFLPEIQ